MLEYEIRDTRPGNHADYSHWIEVQNERALIWMAEEKWECAQEPTASLVAPQKLKQAHPTWLPTKVSVF